MLVALPPPAAVGRAVPPAPPGPPRARPEMRLTASPESPVRASEAEPAPVEAVAEALADAEAGPVPPLAPEAPEVAPPDAARAVPRGAELMAVGLASAAPVAPVEPESPERVRYAFPDSRRLQQRSDASHLRGFPEVPRPS